MTHPSVDVLIPVYNAEATVREAIASILCQSLETIRILIVDDGSTDRSAAILREIAARDPRVQIITQQNTGIVDALNLGLSHCKAKYVARFDADDIAFPEHLERLHDYLEHNPDCVAVGAAVEHMDEAGRPLSGLPHPGNPCLADPTWAPAIEPYLIHPFMMAQRRSVIDAGGYRYVFNSEDSDLFWRLSERGQLHNLAIRGGKYRVHSKSVSSASVLSGRIMAINSQLAAISALRRRNDRDDLRFDKNTLDSLKAAATLEAMWRLAAQRLDAEEGCHLKIAASMKLLELSGYRPFQLESSDYSFIRSSLPLAKRLTPQNRKEARWYVSRAAARIAEQQGWHTALAMTSGAACMKAFAKTKILGRTR